MKYISLLGILTILALCAEVAFQLIAEQNEAVESFQSGMKTGMQQAQNPLEHTLLFPVKAKVISEETPGEATLQLDKGVQTVPYSIGGVRCRIQPGRAILVALSLGSVGVLIFSIYAVYCLIRVLIRISKRDVFSRRNIGWIRWFAYINAGIYLAIICFEWLIEREAVSQLQIPGYQVVGIEHALPYDFSSVLIIVLLAEVYAVAVKIKEEQDLTI